MVDLLARVAELDDARLFPSVVLPGLAGAVSCDAVTYNELDVVTATARSSRYPPAALDANGLLASQTRLSDHPLIRHLRERERSREVGGAHGIAGLAAPREFYALALYGELFRKVGVGYQLEMTIHEPAKSVVGIVLNRSGRDFTQREREFVQLLRRPLAASLERLRRHGDAERPDGKNASSDPRVTTGLDALTEREREVLELVAAGRTDTAIGRTLGCSGRTVGKHLEHAYRKLGVVNRAAAIARVTQSEGRFL